MAALLKNLLEQQGSTANSVVPKTLKLSGADIQNVANKTWKQIKDTSRYGVTEEDATGKVFRFVTKVLK